MKDKNTMKRLLVPFEYDKKRITKGGGRYYNGAILLSEGTFSDSISMSPIVYTKEQLMKIPDNLSMKAEYFRLDDDRIFLDIDHEPNKVLSRIGYVPNIYYHNKALRGDLYLHCLTEASRDIKVLIDAGYVNALSVEILTNDDYGDDGKIYANDIVLMGLAVVTMPACPSAAVIPKE